MKLQAVADALERVKAVLQRRPEAGWHEDGPATSRWAGGTRVVASHANGTQVPTDMPSELGGTGDQVTPGWLFRAGLASCATTSIVLAAVAEGIELTSLEVKASSWSDSRGLLGLPDANDQPVPAGPGDVQLAVRIQADGVPHERLRSLVQAAVGRSPIPNALQSATPLALRIDTA
ncbi:OsmC family protein [Hydrogenophaga sp. 2FB]|uniref:OsmC family protein n=1 Tax=Hydrogenophaga sp. 2FB TaxID=2502187 RepID=UPI0010F9809A|nr:OsmC family protein [Hydrogenophaga sp. 2FB]